MESHYNTREEEEEKEEEKEEEEKEEKGGRDTNQKRWRRNCGGEEKLTRCRGRQDEGRRW